MLAVNYSFIIKKQSMKKTNEASGWRFKTLIFSLLLVFAVSASVQAQPKDKYDDIIEKAKKATDLHFAQGSKEVARLNVDTLTVDLSQVKFVKLNGRIYQSSAFTQSAPVFLSVDGWVMVLEIINNRDYGKLPATSIGQIIQAISQQIPRKEN